MTAYYDCVDQKWRIRCEGGEVSDSLFSTEEDALAAIDLAFDHALEMVLLSERQEHGYRRASERGQKIPTAERA